MARVLTVAMAGVVVAVGLGGLAGAARATVPVFTSAVQLEKPAGWAGVNVLGRSVSASGGYAAVGTVLNPLVAARTGRWMADGTFSFLGTVPGQTRSQVYAIGDDGRAAGRVTVAGSDAYRAARWELDGSGALLGEVAGWVTTESSAFAANGVGQAGGQANLSGVGLRAVRWGADGTAELLDDILEGGPGFSNVMALNDAGEAVGYASPLWEGSRAVRWGADGSARWLGEVPDQRWGVVYGISDAGLATGSAFLATPWQERAVRWTAGGAAELLGDVAGYVTRASRGHGIVDSGLAVGYANLTGFGERAVMWDAGGGARLVQELMGDGNEWVFTQARGVDAEGERLRVLVYGFKNGGAGEYYLIEAVIPEPGGVGVAGAVVVLGGRRRRGGVGA